MGKAVPAKAHLPPSVMAGLDPAIYVDPRVKPGGDDNKKRTRVQARHASTLLLATSLLVACSGRIWQDETSADTVRLHWYTAEASIADARSLADQHCRRADKRAEMVQEFEDGDITIAGFVCVPSRP